MKLSVTLVSHTETRWLSRKNSISRVLKLTTEDFKAIKEVGDEELNRKLEEVNENRQRLIDYETALQPIHEAILMFEVSKHFIINAKI